MSTNNVLIIIAVVVAVALGLGYILGASRQAQTPVAEPVAVPGAVLLATTEGEEEQPPPRSFISRETVEGLYFGLTYEAAEELFGFPSDETESEYDRGVEGYTSPFVIYWHVWGNEDGSRARLGFINNKMDRKQFIAADGVSEIPESPHVDVENYGKILGMEGEDKKR